MCNSRNNTWKKFVEVSFSFDSLIETITDESFKNIDAKAIIC